jgi:hypothetical protein
MTPSLRTHIILAPLEVGRPPMQRRRIGLLTGLAGLVWSALFFASPLAANAGVILQAPTYMGLNSGLVGSWSFDAPDMAGSIAYDRSGQGNNGTLGNIETFTSIPVRTIGKIGQALNFNGSTYVDLANPTSLNNIPRKTISAWMYPRRISASADVGRILDKNHGATAGWFFFICNAGDEGGACEAGETNRVAFNRNFSGASGMWISSNNNAITLNPNPKINGE